MKKVSIIGGGIIGLCSAYYLAKEGYEVLKELVETDEGSHYLGEVALVDHFSPISQSNQICTRWLVHNNVSTLCRKYYVYMV